MSMRSVMRLLVTVVFASLGLLAQIRNATIVGTVTDATGSPVPDAEVSVLETQTNATYPLRTSGDGDYSMPYLPAGRYVVTVKKPGFKVARTTEAELNTSLTLRLDLRLEVGGVDSQVTVIGEAVGLQTESSRITNAVNEQTIRSIPNLNNNPLNYATLQPGVVGRASMNDTQSPNSFGIGVEGRRSISNISINGGAAFTNDIQIDGVSVQSASWNEVAIVPNSEAITEVRTNINNMSAEYGRSQGTVLFSTRSGTNQWHGSGQFRLRNEAFNANLFSNNAQNIPRPAFKVKDTSTTFGGPVVLPKLYNGRDKTFFFVAYEGLRFTQAVQYLRTVPTALERAGDFSRTVVNNAGQFVPLELFDPYNVTRLENGNYTRLPFPNSIIPANRINPFTLKLINEYPLPNRTPDDPTGVNNFLNTQTRPFTRDNWNARLDHKLRAHSLYATLGTNFGLVDGPNGYGPESKGFTQQGGFFAKTVSDRNYFLSIGDTWVITPTLLADVRLGVTRIVTQNLGPIYPDLNYRDYGIPANFDPAIGIPGMLPEIGGINFYSNLTNTAYTGKQEFQTNWIFNASITKVRGAWTHKFGAENRRALANYTDARGSFAINTVQGYTNGSQFGPDGSGGSAVQAPQAGSGLASFLLGAGQIAAGENAVRLALSVPYAAVYTQNDWRVSNRLTVNLGLRWDWQPGPTERYNRLSSFSYNGTTFGSPGQLIFPGVTPGVGRRVYQTSWNDWQPRIGLAYRASDTLVVRSGFGINYLPTNSGYYGGPYYYGVQNFAPNTIAQPFGANPAGALVGTFNQVTAFVPALGANATAPQYYGDGSNQPRFLYDGQKNARALQWNLFLEKRLGQSFIASAGYAGTRSYNLQFGRVAVNSFQFLPDSTINQWRASYIANNGVDPGVQQVPNTFQTGGSLIPYAGEFGRATINRRTSLLPYPLFPNSIVGAPIGYSNYRALMLQLNKTFSHGLSFNVHYTWSKSLQFGGYEAEINNYSENGGLFNGNIDRRNYRNTYALSPNDVPHRLVLSGVYELPVGKGKAVLSGGGLAGALLGGWQVAPVLTIQAGQPQSVSGGPGLNNQPDRVAGVPLELPANLQKWYDSPNTADRTVALPSGRTIVVNRYTYLKYNPDAFSQPVVRLANGNYAQQIYYFGNTARYLDEFRSPGRYNVNMSLAKTFNLREKVNILFSAEATNLLNNAQFRPTALNGGTGNAIVAPVAARGERAGQIQGQNFGSYTLSFFDPRQVELRLRVRF